MTGTINRRTLLAAAPATVAALGIRPASAWATPSCAFLALGDWGRDGSPSQRAVADQMARAAKAADSRFVVALGDNFYPKGVQSVADSHWKRAFEEVYTAASLQTPWYAILGNHDYSGVPQAELDYAAASPRWRMPARYYAVEGAGFGAPWMDMFMIDTSPLAASGSPVDSAASRRVTGQNPALQLQWLDQTLARSTARLKLVFGHHTVFSGSPVHGDNPVLIESLRPILERHGVTAYVSGHDHDLQHIRVGSVDYVCSGSGSEARKTGRRDGTLFAAARRGFAVFSTTPEALRLQFQDDTGALRYETRIQPRADGSSFL